MCRMILIFGLVACFLMSACNDPKGASKEMAARTQVALGVAPKPDPTQTSPTSSLDFHGFDLSQGPVTTAPYQYADLYEEVPPGSRSFEIRKDIEIVYQGYDGVVYSIPGQSRFYIQHDSPLSSSLHYYGPFSGDPTQIMDLSTSPTLDEVFAAMPRPRQ